MGGLRALFTACLALFAKKAPDPRVCRREGASSVVHNVPATDQRDAAPCQLNLQLVTISEVASFPVIEIVNSSVSYFIPFPVGDIEVRDVWNDCDWGIEEVVAVDTTKEATAAEGSCPSTFVTDTWYGEAAWDILWDAIPMPQITIPIACDLMALRLVWPLARSAIPVIGDVIRKLALGAILKSRLARVERLHVAILLLMLMVTLMFPAPKVISWFTMFSSRFILTVVVTDDFLKYNHTGMFHLSIGVFAISLAAVHGYAGSALYFGKAAILNIAGALKSLSFFEAAVLVILSLQLVAMSYGAAALWKKQANDAPVYENFKHKHPGAWKFVEDGITPNPIMVSKRARDDLRDKEVSDIDEKQEIEAPAGNSQVENLIDHTAGWVKNFVRNVLPA